MDFESHDPLCSHKSDLLQDRLQREPRDSLSTDKDLLDAAEGTLPSGASAGHFQLVEAKLFSPRQVFFHRQALIEVIII